MRTRVWAGIATLVVLSGLSLAPARAQSEADIAGLWFFQTHFPIGLEGELTLTRHGDRWRGEIGGVVAEGVAVGRGVRISFPNDGSVFRGVIDAQGRPERGYWVRREMTDDPRYPEGAAQAYAGPLVLRADGANRWRSTVQPLKDPFTLYLNIFRDQSGALKAAIRNPEHNRHGPAMQLDVTRDGDALRLAAPGSGEGALQARYRAVRSASRCTGRESTAP